MTLSINPNQADIFEKVRDIVANKLSLDGSKITPQSNFANDLGVDSLDAVELVMALEEQFNIKVPEEVTEKMTTIQEAVDYIDRHF
jgi:acyl carrier protein